MLQSIHDRLKGWLAGVVLGAIGLVFVFWGINWTMTAPNYAAKVNGSEISSNEVRQAYQQQLAQFERQSNGTLDDVQRNEIKRHVLDEYVNSEAVVTRADELGYRVSDADLLKAMGQVPAFQVDGKFDLAHAVAVLKAQGRSVSEIEGLFRRDVKLRQLDSALQQSSFATASEVKQLRMLTRQQREVSWITVPAAKYIAAATADDAAIKAYYDARKAQYMTPETVNLRYVEISMAQIESQVKVDDAQLKAFYEEQKTKTPERFTQPEQRRIRHILLQADAKDDAAAKAKAEDLSKRAKGGEDFAKLAKEFSQDTGSASQGGDLGLSERKAFVAPFADAAFSMKEGEISGPVKSQFGYHIIKVDSIQPATVKTFEQAKGDLDAEYRRNEAERLFNNTQDQLADAALQNTTDIDVVARKAGLTVHDIPNFSRIDGGGDLGKAAPVIEAAFSQDVLDGRLSPTVEIEKGRGVVLRATDHKLPEQKPLDAVRTDIVAAWKKQKGAELAAAAAADAVKRLNAGEAWDAVAKSLVGAPAPPGKFVSRNDQAIPIDIRREAFQGPKPAGKPLYDNLVLEDGDAAVVAVTAVREDPEGDAKQQDAQLRRQYAQQAASAEAQSYALAARADAKVTLNAQALD
jgi:peptidyl-prolyl cis-trans isomerase D